MTRVKRGAVARKRRKKLILLIKGGVGSSANLFRIAQQHAMKARLNSYRDRRKRKYQYRSLWIVRLKARARTYGGNYSNFFSSLRKKKCLLNRKVLRQLAIYDPPSFQALLDLFLNLCLYFFSEFLKKLLKRKNHRLVITLSIIRIPI